MKKRKKSLLIALTLGDGYISQQGQIATLRLQHSQQQLPYLQHKVDLLHSLVGGKKPKIHLLDKFDPRTKRTYKSCVATRTSRLFKHIRKIFYPNGKKLISLNVLKYLDAEGLAIWFQDDGWSQFRLSKKTGKISSQQSYLGTYCTKDEALLIQTYFKQIWNLEFKYYPTHNGSYVMCANTKDSLDFIEIIKPYIIPMFEYKIRPINLTTNARPLQG